LADWARSAIWWQVYPLGFTAAEKTAAPTQETVHRLPRLLSWLDYLVDLGCNGLALGPVFAAETHGYDTVDHRRIDPRLGDRSDFDALVAACHDRGIRVLLDGVFNHVGRSFAPFQDVLAHGHQSEFAGWFRLGPERDGEITYDDFEGHRHLVALNHDEPAVADYVSDVMTFWLDAGADGWRLDAAYAVPLDFWGQVSDRVRARHPDAWLVGEVLHAPYEPFVDTGHLDSVTQYELWKAAWSSLNDGNLFELSWALQRHNGFCETFRPLTFLGNHDVTRIASRLDDARHLGHALVLLMTVAGIPSIYAGDEQRFTGVKEESERGDDAVRPPFPDDPSGLAPYGRDAFVLHQRLISLRRRHPWLTEARTEVLGQTNTSLAYRSASADGELTVLLNIADEPHTFSDAGGNHVVPPHGWAVLGDAASDQLISSTSS
jgi:cyclomaltodextrinase / maltogenic alpha-amylase / neopullulanase